MRENEPTTASFSTLGDAIVTVVGESLVDIISDPRQAERTQAHAGGSPLNVAVGAARLGMSATLVTHYAEDRYGLMLEEHLHSNGVTRDQRRQRAHLNGNRYAQSRRGSHV